MGSEVAVGDHECPQGSSFYIPVTSSMLWLESNRVAPHCIVLTSTGSKSVYLKVPTKDPSRFRFGRRLGWQCKTRTAPFPASPMIVSHDASAADWTSLPLTRLTCPPSVPRIRKLSSARMPAPVICSPLASPVCRRRGARLWWCGNWSCIVFGGNVLSSSFVVASSSMGQGAGQTRKTPRLVSATRLEAEKQSPVMSKETASPALAVTGAGELPPKYIHRRGIGGKCHTLGT
jgi:hypothetical protein